jgi:hypothetical protein
MQVLTGAKVSSEAKMGKSQLPAPPVVGKIHLPPIEEFMTADLFKEREREKQRVQPSLKPVYKRDRIFYDVTS